MRNFQLLFVLLLCAAICVAAPVPQNAAAPATPQAQQNAPHDQTMQANETLSPESEDKLVREVRHELIMLPYYGVFDNLTFGIDGRTVTLNGQVVQPVTRSDAEKAVKHIEGVEKVVNNIEILPPSNMDDRVRRQVYNSIYSYGPLFKYGNMAVPPIHIIVRNARITLDGVVDSESDKNYAGVRANMVPGTFGVTNNLRVIPSNNESKKKKK
ncbi:MAG: BON domain-containing protein [Candidatus Korobacteraceae bacterium]